MPSPSSTDRHAPPGERPHAFALAVPLYLEHQRMAGGEVAVFPYRQGTRVEVSFASPYEDIVLVDGTRLTTPKTPEAVALRIHLSRRLLALYQALETTHGLIGAWSADALFVHDLVDKETNAFADHREIQRRLALTKLRLPPFAVLGEVASLGELNARTRTMYAAGTLLEVRHEDSGVVSARRQVVVGRGD